MMFITLNLELCNNVKAKKPEMSNEIVKLY